MKAIGYSLLDHVIIGEDGYYSFTNETIKKLDNHTKKKTKSHVRQNLQH